MQYRDDRVALGINNKDDPIHSFSIGCGYAAVQASELSATDHERSTPAAYKRRPIGI
jgi:hypothetical protein